MLLKVFYIIINYKSNLDKCIILKMNVEDLIVLEKKSEVCSILTTPVKKNDDNSKKEKK